MEKHHMWANPSFNLVYDFSLDLSVVEIKVFKQEIMNKPKYHFSQA
jgi:hypothetical protein